MKPSVYLAGPITGLNYDECVEWRNQATRALYPDIDCFSPMRNKPYLKGTKQIGMAYEHHPLSSQRGIFARDFHDVISCDVLLINFWGAPKVSIGTVMEVAWAYQARKPIVAIMEPTIRADEIEKRGNPHNHAMLMEAIPYVVDSLDEAVHIIRSLLLPEQV